MRCGSTRSGLPTQETSGRCPGAHGVKGEWLALNSEHEIKSLSLLLSGNMGISVGAQLRETSGCQERAGLLEAVSARE